MKASGEATQCTKLGRAECKEQHSSGGCSPEKTLQGTELRRPQDDTTPAPDVDLVLKEEHSQAMQGCRSRTTIHERARPPNTKFAQLEHQSDEFD